MKSLKGSEIKRSEIKIGERSIALLLAALMITTAFAGILVFIPTNVKAKGGSQPHDPILIYGNDGFTSANGVTGGSGTKDDPYIIEGWIIDASSTHGIFIMYTDAYFIIRNVTIENGYSNGYDGIALLNVTNGKIENCIISNNNNGISLDFSSNIIITSNNISNNENGIVSVSSSNNNITKNNIFNNDEGIRLDSSSSNNITKNNIFNNYWGIWLSSGSSSNNITKNNIISNDFEGIYLDSSDNNIITSNNITSNEWGIYLYKSSNNLIYNNYFDNPYGNYRVEDSSDNKWNITKTPGKNIIGGSYLGGNYWSDYTGKDTNGDGLGDEDQNGAKYGLYGPGDCHPLVKPSVAKPPTADFTYSPSNPTTADIIQFTDNSADPDGYIVNWTWSFGDGNISYEQNPTHKYANNGTYEVTLTVTDDDGATDSITKQITVSNAPLSVKIVKPKNALYIRNKEIISLRRPIIFGPITIKAEGRGIEKVEFYINNKLKATVTTPPYEWLWNERVLFKHTIKVVAYDAYNNTATDEEAVWIFCSHHHFLIK